MCARIRLIGLEAQKLPIADQRHTCRSCPDSPRFIGVMSVRALDAENDFEGRLSLVTNQVAEYPLQ